MHPLVYHIMAGRKGRLLAHSDYLTTVLDKYGLCVGGTLRAELVDLLAAPLQQAGALSYSQEVCSLAHSAGGSQVTAGLTDGTSLTADLVVGADGINSFVARTVFGEGHDHPPIHSGENIFYGVIQQDQPPAFRSPYLGRPHTLFQQLDQGEFIYFPVGGKANNTAVWALAHTAAAAPAREEWEGAEGVVRGEVDELLNKKHRPDHPAWECLAHTSDDRLLHFGLFYRQYRARWTQGRVCLLGDSAHATLPYIGQG